MINCVQVKNFEFEVTSSNLEMSKAGKPCLPQNITSGVTCFEIISKRDIKINSWIRCQLILE